MNELQALFWLVEWIDRIIYAGFGVTVVVGLLVVVRVVLNAKRSR